jgi:hypothetical protein
MADLIWVDENGKEVSRKVKGKGRPPKNSEKREDGNFYVLPSSTDEAFKPKYVVLDKDGKLLKEEPKGRGRPKPDFTKAEDGEFKGHWVKREVADSA